MRFVYLPKLAAPVALALTVAACNGSGSGSLKSPKHLKPLSADTYVELEKKEMRKEDPILIRIYKQESKLEVWKQRQKDGRYAHFKTYDICRWSGKLGPKVKEGDRQAPEGFYTISPGQMNPKSSYYLSFNIGFPNAYDRAYGRTGLHLMVHGACSSAGCYSMNDENIAEIYALAREAFDGGQAGFQVQALPFRMTPDNLAQHRNNPNISFWKNLKEGTDSFEVTRQEPKVEVCGKRYIFNATPKDPLGQFEAAAPCPAYEVPPEIETAVAAKAKADEMRIAALSLEVQPAPIDVGQNGPLPPAAAPVMVAQGSTPAAPPASTAKPGSTLAFAPVPVPKPGVSRPSVQVASVDGASVPASGVPSRLARWFGLDDEKPEPAKDQTGSVQTLPAVAPAPVAAAPAATPAPRPVQPVAVAPAPRPAPVAASVAAAPPTPAAKPLLKRVMPDWVGSQPSPPAAAPVAAAPPPAPAAPAAAAPVPAAESKARVNSAFAAFN